IDSEADKISLLFIYFPIIRTEVYTFAKLWNIHCIRYQRNRPSLPTGKPSVLFFTPPSGIQNYQYCPDRTLLAQLEAEVSAWDPEEYRPPETYSW
ncbi:hypothetical protein B9Z19DRAFT_918803, partial [Tuber borchii]